MFLRTGGVCARCWGTGFSCALVSVTLALQTALAVDPPRALSEAVEPAIVAIRAEGPGGILQGSGFLIDQSGWVVTSCRLVADATSVKVVVHDGQSLRVIGFNGASPERDIAILRVDARGPLPGALVLAKSLPAQDQGVFAVGRGDTVVWASGKSKRIVNAADLARDDNTARPYEELGLAGGPWLSTTVTTTDTFSGGPLVDDEGYVVGVRAFSGTNGGTIACSAATLSELMVAAKRANIQALSSMPRSRRTHPPVERGGSTLVEATIPLKGSEISERVWPSIVRVDVNSGGEKAFGSGFVAETRGIVVTNYHVVRDADAATCTFKDRRFCSVRGYIAADPGKDLALLMLDNPPLLQALPVAQRPPRDAEKVFAFGAPEGWDATVTEGIVSATRIGRDILSNEVNGPLYRLHGYSADAEWIQSTAPISHGSSGGPLVSELGVVVGINTWNDNSGQNLNFAASCRGIAEMLASARGATCKPFSTLPRATPPNVASLLPGIPPDAPSRAKREWRVALPSGRVLTSAGTVPSHEEMLSLAEQGAHISVDVAAVVKYPSGRVLAVAGHDVEKLDGGLIAFHEDGTPMLKSVYDDGNRSGILQSFAPTGEIEFYCEYARGKKNGVACVFSANSPKLVVEYTFDAAKALHLVDASVITKSFKSAGEAKGDQSASSLLQQLDDRQRSIADVEARIRKLVSEQSKSVRQARASALAPERRAAISDRAAERSAKSNAILKGLTRKAVGAN